MLILTIVALQASNGHPGSDTTAAALTSFSFTPDTVDVSLEPDTVTIEMGAVDDLSGLYDANVFFRSPSGLQNAVGRIVFEFGSLSDTATGVIVIDRYAEAGDWFVQEIHLYDAVGNEAIYTTADLQTLEFPTIITVLCANEVEEEQIVPMTFTLFQNYPNPFNPTTTIKYALPVESKVTILIYNALGETVIELVNELQSAGYQEAVWNANNITSGVYIYSLNAEPTSGGKIFNSIKKMLLIK